MERGKGSPPPGAWSRWGVPPVGAPARVAARAAALAALAAAPAGAQMYGPRQFWPAPVGTEVLTVAGIFTSSNTVVDTSIVFPKLDVDTWVVAPSYTRFFAVGDQLVQGTVALPWARADVAIAEPRTGLARSPVREGLADAYGHVTVGLVNAPALAPAAFSAFMAQRNPGVVVVALAGGFAPTGAYDSQRLVNIGTNRWTFRAGLPITARLSPSWAPGKTTTFEALPSLDVFTPNNNPAAPSLNGRLNGPSQTTQDPLAALELHLTHDLTPRLWVSLDSYSKVGGATAADGRSNDNQQLWSALGASVGGSPWTRARLALTAGGVVAGNGNSPNGWLVRLQLQQSW